MGKKGGSFSAPPPDPNVGLAMKRQAEIAEKQQAWYENVVYPELRKQTALQNQWSIEDRQFARQNADWWKNYTTDQTNRINKRADEYYDRWKNTFKPVEDSLAADARRYNSSAEAERQASLGIADVTQAMNAERQKQEMRMSQLGVSPTSGAYMGQQNQLALQQAGMRAAAANQARQAANALGWEKKSKVAALGQQYIANSMQANQVANQAAGTAGGLTNNSIGQASGFGQLGTANLTNAANVGIQSYQSMGNAWGNLGDLAMKKSNYSLDAWKTQQQMASQERQGMMSAIGSIAGAGIAAF